MTDEPFDFEELQAEMFLAGEIDREVQKIVFIFDHLTRDSQVQVALYFLAQSYYIQRMQGDPWNLLPLWDKQMDAIYRKVVKAAYEGKKVRWLPINKEVK